MGEEQQNNKPPLKVKSVPEDKVDKNEMEIIYKELAKTYCICKHRKDRHYKGEYNCEFKATRMFEGQMEEFTCQCQLYESLENAANVETPSKEPAFE